MDLHVRPLQSRQQSGKRTTGSLHPIGSVRLSCNVLVGWNRPSTTAAAAHRRVSRVCNNVARTRSASALIGVSGAVCPRAVARATDWILCRKLTGFCFDPAAKCLEQPTGRFLGYRRRTGRLGNRCQIAGNHGDDLPVAASEDQNQARHGVSREPRRVNSLEQFQIVAMEHNQPTKRQKRPRRLAAVADLFEKAMKSRQ